MTNSDTLSMLLEICYRQLAEKDGNDETMIDAKGFKSTVESSPATYYSRH